MKLSSRWLLYIVPVLLCCALAVVYLLSIKKIIRPFAMPAVKDTLTTQAFALDVIKAQSDMYTPLYMGKWQQNITVTHSAIPDAYLFADGAFSFRYRQADIQRLQLLVDTTRYITDYRKDWDADTDSMHYYTVKSYPVMLANLSGDTLQVGDGVSLPFRQEAMDSTGKWKPIEDYYSYGCGTGLPGICLPPGEIAIVAAPVYQGSYRTRMRIRYSNLVSQEFAGSINPQQFNTRWPYK